MFIDPSLTVTAVFSWLRDSAIVYGIMKVVWRSRGVYQGVVDFKKAVLGHMQRMEGFALRAEENHFKHMEYYLYKIAKDRNLITIKEPQEVEMDDVPPPEGIDIDAV